MRDWRAEKVVIVGPWQTEAAKNGWATGGGEGRLASIEFSDAGHDVYGTITVIGKTVAEFTSRMTAWLGPQMCDEWGRGLLLAKSHEKTFPNIKVILHNGKLASVQAWFVTEISPPTEDAKHD